MPEVPLPLPRPALRLFQGDESADDDQAPTLAKPLSKVFDAMKSRRLADCEAAGRRAPTPQHWAKFETLLLYWKTFTGDPPLAELSGARFDDYLRLFRYGLGSLRSGRQGALRPATIAGHLTHLQLLLNAAGPRGPRRSDSFSLLLDVPRVPLPDVVYDSPAGGFTLEGIERLLAATDAAGGPKWIPPRCRAAWWQELILLFYNTGQRPHALFDARWEWIKGEWLVVPADSMKSKARNHAVYLNAAALASLERLRRLNLREHPRILHRAEQPYPAYHSLLLRQLRECICPRAGVRGTLYDLRRACATQAYRINPTAASLQLGHAVPGAARMTTDHYAGRQVQADGIALLPQPRRPEESTSDRQRLLF